MKADNVRALPRSEPRSFVTLNARKAHLSDKDIGRRARRRRWSFLNASANAVAGAMLAWIALAAMDVMPQAASLDLPLVTNAAASAPSHEPIISLVDLDADGKADFANPTNSFVRSVDGYGSGSFGAHRDGVRGGRAHHGADYISVPGETVRAPINGAITRIGYAYRRNVSLRFIEVRDANTQNTARVFYVAPTVAIGDTVFAGQEIGSAQSLQTRYPGITNHVHVEIDDARGKAIDPETVLPAPVTNYVFNAGMRPVQTASQQPS